MARFVLLFHDCPADVPRPPHCDLMLESAGVLRTWVLAELPRDWAPLALPATGGSTPLKLAHENSVFAERLADHRLAYLDYEGPLSGNRGSVTRLDRGTLETIRETADRWEVTLNGQVLRGSLRLRRASDSGTAWQLTAGDR